MHSALVVPQAALLGRPVVALVAGEGDETVLRHLVHLQAVGLGGLHGVSDDHLADQRQIRVKLRSIIFYLIVLNYIRGCVSRSGSALDP